VRDGLAGRLGADDVDERVFSRYLSTSELPDPDLLIRTSGELRVSNFLRWQIAYSEIWVTKDPWPDFTREHLLAAIRDYQSRDRRFGRVESKKASLGKLFLPAGKK
jgi:undecaprenyl diphosphate synthase